MMKQRIRVAAILVKEGKVLLVKHVHPKTKYQWWVPPGGGLEATDASIYECVIREAWEETGYQIKVEDILYIREFKDDERDILNLELFMRGHVVDGYLTVENIYGKGEDDAYIKEAQWLSQKELMALNVFPEIIKENIFWEEIKKDSIKTRYLGRSN
ncbi:NUDIX hydrolase [Cellulosilyticum sp. WCF-2]|nr:NUDIX hydrolase [Cellulosilyticum sp. WCF-2]